MLRKIQEMLSKPCYSWKKARFALSALTAIVTFEVAILNTYATDIFESNSPFRSDTSEPEVLLADSEITELPPAPGAEPSPFEALLQRRLSALESEYEHLRQRLEIDVPAPGRLRSTDISPIEPPTKTPTYPNVKVTGFFQLDAGYFQQSDRSVAQYGTIENDGGFRRARLATVGDVSRTVSYLIEMDFAFPGRPTFMDVWLDVHEVPLFGNVRVGQWRQPFGLDELTSVRELTFLERPTMFALAPFRETGIGFHDTNEEQSVTWAGSVFGFPTDAWGNFYGNKGVGTAFRLTANPINENDGRQLLHIGFDHSYNVPSNDLGASFRNTPEFSGPFGSRASQVVPGGTANGGTVGDVPFFFDTGPLNYDNANLVNAEFAGVYNSFHWQSELRYSFLDFGGSTVTIPAFYVQAAYLLTGEVRPYNKVAGVLGRIKPLHSWGDSGGYGAWEVAARYSYINTNPTTPFQPAPVVDGRPWGGALNNVTLGVNWYLNQYTKFQINYIMANNNRGGVDSTTDIVALRAQLDF